EVRLLSVADGKEQFTAEFTDYVHQCGFSGDGKTYYLITVAAADAKQEHAEARLQRWEVQSGKKLPDITGLRHPCVVSGDMQYALAQMDVAAIHSIDLATGQRSPQPVAVEASNRGTVFLPDSRHFATFGNREIHLWDLRRPVTVAHNFLFRA